MAACTLPPDVQEEALLGLPPAELPPAEGSGGGDRSRRWGPLRARAALAAALGLAGLGLYAAAPGRTRAARVEEAALVPVQEWEGFGGRYCGVVHNPHLCPELYYVLGSTYAGGAESILCKAVPLLGSRECQLDMELRSWEQIDPSQCTKEPRLLFLWDVLDSMNADPTGGLEDDPLCGGPGLPACPEWVAQVWMEYVDKWRPKLVAARAAGLRVTSPMFGGDVLSKMERFFAACPDCNQQGSPYYIDTFAFNNFIDPFQMAGSFARIRDIATKLRQRYPNRPVFLGNLHTGAQTAAQDANIIMNSGIFDRAGSPVDAVYWNVYPKPYSYRGARNCLEDKVLQGPQAGKTVGQVFMEKCGPER